MKSESSGLVDTSSVDVTEGRKRGREESKLKMQQKQ